MQPIFGTWDAIAQRAGASVKSELARRIALEGITAVIADPVRVLVPSSASAGAVAAATASGGGDPGVLAGVEFLTLDVFARRLLEKAGQFPHVATDLERRTAMTIALRSRDEALARSRSAPALFERTYRDLRDAGHNIDLVQRQASRLRDRRIATLLTAVWRRYETLINASGAIDPADLLTRAASLVPQAPQPVFAIYGFYDATGVQRSLLAAVAAANPPALLCVPLVRAAGELDPALRFGSSFTSWAAAQGEPTELPLTSVPEPLLAPFDSIHEELRETSRSIAALLASGTAAGHIGIVIRSADAAVERLLRTEASEFGFAIASRSQRTFATHRLGRAMLTFVETAARRFPRLDVLSLLRSDLRLSNRSAAAIDRASRRAEIAGGPADRVERSISGARIDREETAADVAGYLEALRTIEPIAREMAAPLSPQRWASLLSTILGHFIPSTDDDLAAISCAEDVIRDIRRLAKFAAPIDPSAISELLRSRGFRAGSDDGLPQVWFGDVMSLRGRTFDHLFVIGMRADRFPQRRADDPLLSDGDRTALGLPRIGDGREEEELLFRLTWLSARESVTMSVAAHDLNGKSLRPSPFIQRLAFRYAEDASARRRIFHDFFRAVPPAPRAQSASATETAVRQFISGAAPASPALSRALRLVHGTGTASEYDGYIRTDAEVGAHVAERLTTVPATHFEDFGECPQKFFYKRLARIEELADPEHSSQIDRLNKGGLDHSILERFYRNVDRETLAGWSDVLTGRLSREALDQLADAVDEEFDRFDADRPPTNATIRRLEREVTFRTLARFVAKDLENMREQGLSPVWFEYSFGTDRKGPPDADAVQLDAGGHVVSVRGVIDRIDRDASGTRLRIVDYKGGGALKYKKLEELIRSGRRMQLAFYALAAEKIFGVPAESISGAILPLRSDEKKTETFEFALGSCREDVLQNVRLFAAAIIRGEFAAIHDESACISCPVGHSCRTRYSTPEVQPGAASVRDLLLQAAADAVAEREDAK